MPKLLAVGAYVVYFWTNEGNPVEPIHVHVSIKRPSNNGSKVWITRSGHALMANNKADISNSDMEAVLMVIEANASKIVAQWEALFGTVSYYC